MSEGVPEHCRDLRPDLTLRRLALLEEEWWIQSSQSLLSIAGIESESGIVTYP